jgi:hypothetical protein
LAARNTFLPSSGAAIRPAKGSGGQLEQPLPATLGSFGSHLPKPPHPLFCQHTVNKLLSLHPQFQTLIRYPMPPNNDLALDPLLKSMDPKTPKTLPLPKKQTPNKKTQITKEDMEKTPKPKNTKKKNSNWAIEEDKQLCVAWLNTSRDSIVGIGQKGATFWERVYTFYTDLVDDINKENKNMKKFKLLPLRLLNAIECCWGHILKVCNKFGGCYSQVKRQMKSGRSRDNIVSILSL